MLYPDEVWYETDGEVLGLNRLMISGGYGKNLLGTVSNIPIIIQPWSDGSSRI